jgi:hypothetical protein
MTRSRAQQFDGGGDFVVQVGRERGGTVGPAPHEVDHEHGGATARSEARCLADWVFRAEATKELRIHVPPKCNAGL